MLEPTTCWAAVHRRDRRFDGVFFVGVKTTGIYCRPVCPARTPLEKNCTYHRSAAAAEAAGFRACLRCRPERAPGAAPCDAIGWVLRRAISRIEAGEQRVGVLAEAVGVSERHLRRIFEQELGTSPSRFVSTRRLALARTLLRDTSVPLDEVARGAGFASMRRFQAAWKESVGDPPSELRRNNDKTPSVVTVRLDARPPFDGRALMAFFTARALPGIEAGEADALHRVLRVGKRVGVLTVRLAGDERSPGVQVSVSPELTGALPRIVSDVRRTFDLDAQPEAILEHLGLDPLLCVSERPGLRLPGALDPFELAVRAVVGQRISVAAASTVLARVCTALGEPVSTADPRLTLVFPTPAAVAAATLDTLGSLGLPRTKGEALRLLAEAVCDERVYLGPAADPHELIDTLLGIRGIGPWTAQLIALRGLSWPDAFPAQDYVVLKRLGTARAANARAEAWRPYRGIGLVHLWAQELA